MNILWINHEYPPIGGGGATVSKALAHEFAVLGHSVTVVSAAYKDTPLFETGDGFDVYRLKCKRRSKDQSTFIEMLSFLIVAFNFVPKLIKKKRFDVIYIFFGIPNGPLGWYIKKRYKIPYIILLGGGDIPGTQKRFRVIYMLLGPVLKAIWRNAKFVVANSKGLRERAEKYYSKAKFTVIYNGVNLKHFLNKKKYRNEKFGIVTTARIVERKGIQHVVEALPDLVRETNGNIRYIVIGDGPYRKEVETLAKKLNVRKYIEITGMISFDNVINKLSEADIFVLTSHWEGMPNAVTEAMAMRLPIIMSDCEGSTELINGNGFIIPNDKNIVNELVDKVLRLYNDRVLADIMGNTSYERVCELFLWEKSAKKYLELLQVY